MESLRTTGVTLFGLDDSHPEVLAAMSTVRSENVILAKEARETYKLTRVETVRVLKEAGLTGVQAAAALLKYEELKAAEAA